MTRPPSLSHPFLLGFDDIERALDRVAKGASEGYPPYNIERMPRTEDEPDRLRITLAVAGFAREQLEITLEENQLTIRGRQSDDKNRQFLHRGIAARQFQRSFLLAEGIVFAEQPQETLAAVARHVAKIPAPLALAGAHNVMTLTGSAILTLALANGQIDPDAAWDAAHLDEDYQIGIWGQDEEAAERRVIRRREFDAAVLLLKG